MKEAISTTFIFNLVLIFTGVFVALYVGSISYTKGFKIRNRIIDILEEYNGYNEAAALKIDDNLSAIGYKIVQNPDCKARKEGSVLMETLSNYDYCIYQFKDKYGYYYGVTAFIHVDVPLVGGLFDIPIYGETRTLYDLDGVEG